MDQKSLFTKVQSRLASYCETYSLLTLCEFAGVTVGTIEGWAIGRHPANGENLLRLWHFLAAAGYPSPEMKKLDPYAFYVSQLLAYSIINLEEAGQILGVKTVQSTHKQLRGEHKPAVPTFGLEELKVMYDEHLQKAKMKLKEQLAEVEGSQESPTMARGPSQGSSQHERPSSSESRQEPVVSFVGGKDTLMLELATALSSALPLARYMNSDRCTPADRSYLRDLMGDGGMFEISNILNSLCSERARTDMKGRKP